MRWYRHLLFEEYRIPEEAVGLYRLLFVAVSLLLVGAPSVYWVSEIPEYLYTPQRFSIVRLLGYRMPGPAALLTLDLSILLAYLLLLFGVKTRWSSLGLGLLLLLSFSIKFTIGKIGHGIMLNIIPLVMAFSAWGRAFVLGARPAGRPNYTGFAIFVLAWLFSFGMFTSGMSKLLGGWHRPDFFGACYHFNYRYYTWLDKQSLLAPVFADVKSIVFWKAMDYGTLLFELGFMVAVFKKRLFQLFCVVGILFHVATLLIFNIAYINNLLVYLLFIRWRPVLWYLEEKRWLPKLRRSITLKNLLLVAAFSLILYVLMVLVLDVHLSRDKLISPLSLLAYCTEYNFREIRGVLLLVSAPLVLLWTLYISRRYDRLVRAEKRQITEGEG